MASKKLIHSQIVTIPNASNGFTARFQPQAGFITHCAIFYPSTIPNPGAVTAKITNDQGEDYAPMQDIRNYRDREAGYFEGKMPLFIEATGQTFVLEIAAASAFTAACPITLVLVYQKDYQQQNC